jgi:hypothetical protein
LNTKTQGTQACQNHQDQWKKYKDAHSSHSLAGVRRMLQRPNENMEWNPTQNRRVQPHDVPMPERELTHYFSPSRFYCVETICAPCGVVIAWAKFAKAESPCNIMQFLGAVYPSEESRPDYICIDKACVLLRHAIASGAWDTWKNTSRFIVDSYHYTNRQATDFLCRTYCNPAPQDGSAPNLVIVDYDKNGRPYLKRAFNTQACEQLNAWLGGFDSILKRMTPSNFDWFLHTMLFYHSQYVIEKQRRKQDKTEGNSEDSDDSEDDGDL